MITTHTLWAARREANGCRMWLLLASCGVGREVEEAAAAAFSRATACPHRARPSPRLCRCIRSQRVSVSRARPRAVTHARAAAQRLSAVPETGGRLELRHGNAPLRGATSGAGSGQSRRTLAGTRVTSACTEPGGVAPLVGSSCCMGALRGYKKIPGRGSKNCPKFLHGKDGQRIVIMNGANHSPIQSAVVEQIEN
jgi:hypothetical protein